MVVTRGFSTEDDSVRPLTVTQNPELARVLWITIETYGKRVFMNVNAARPPYWPYYRAWHPRRRRYDGSRGPTIRDAARAPIIAKQLLGKRAFCAMRYETVDLGNFIVSVVGW